MHKKEHNGILKKLLVMYSAEYEGLPMYVFSEKSTRRAISRPCYRVIGKGDIVQLNLSAKVDGYSPSIGLPISMGKLEGKKKEIVEFCLEAHKWTATKLKAGIKSFSIAEEYIEFFRNHGYRDNYLYGPCHGLGMIEVEPPWMETISDYILEKNMTFQIDTFVSTPDFGVRWEAGTVIEDNGCSLLSNPHRKIIEIDI